MSIALSNFVQVRRGHATEAIPPMVNEVYNIGGISVSLEADHHRRRHSGAAGGILVSSTRLLAGAIAQLRREQDRKINGAAWHRRRPRTISITFIMGAALAYVAGTLFLMYYGVVSFSDGFVPGAKAFTAAVLGGIGSLPGALCSAGC